MLIFLYGADSFRRNEKLKSIVEAYKEKRGEANFASFNFEDAEASRGFMEFVRNQSMFSPKRMAVLNEIDFGEAKKEGVLKDLKQVLKEAPSSKDVTIIISSAKKPGKDFAFLLQDETIQSQEFEDLKTSKLISFVAKEALKCGLKIDKFQIAELAESFESDSWGLINELEKMSLNEKYLFKAKSANEYFPTFNKFKFGRTPAEKLIALEILLNDLKEDPARIFNGLPYGRPVGASDDWMKRLADYDVAVKSGKMDYEEVLVDLAIN